MVTVREARERLGISREKMRKLLGEGRFTQYVNPRDARSKLLDTDELDAYLEPRRRVPVPPATDQEATE